jgi:hypothetical protein
MLRIYIGEQNLQQRKLLDSGDLHNAPIDDEPTIKLNCIFKHELSFNSW